MVFPVVVVVAFTAISYPESSGSLANGRLPGETLGTGILLPQDFCGKTMQAVMGQPIKKNSFFFFFEFSNLVPRVFRLFSQRGKKPEDSGYEIVYEIANSPESLLATNRWPKSLRTLGARLHIPRTKVL